MSEFYDRMAATSLRLLTQYGQAVTVGRAVPGAYDPATGGTAADTVTTQEGVGVMRDCSARYVPATLIEAGDRRVILAASGLAWTPEPGDIVTVQSVAWRVVGVGPKDPAGTALVYDLQVRQ